MKVFLALNADGTVRGEGAIFSDGSAVLRHMTEPRWTSIFGAIAALEESAAINGYRLSFQEGDRDGEGASDVHEG